MYNKWKINKNYFSNCFEISPGFLKGQLRVVNPFERIFKDFLKFLYILDREEIHNEEIYNKLVKNYYIYKNQFKRYGLTFPIKDKNENKFLPSKIFFLPEITYLKFKDFKDIKNKFSYKGNDYFLMYYYHINDKYQEKDNKASFELNFCYFNLNDCREKFNIQLISLHEQYQQNIKPSNDDLLYIDAIKLCKSFNSLKKELTERELINYKRIKDIPFLFDFNKFLKYDKDSDLDLHDYDSFSKIYQKTLKNAPLFSVDKNDFILMLNIMYEDQYLSYFKQKGIIQKENFMKWNMMNM